MKKYLKLARVHHYIKNIFIFLPLFFSLKLLDGGLFIKCVLGFLGFSFMTSAVYVINDLRDLEKDRLHPKKKLRPIASGDVSVKNAIIFTAFLLILSGIFCALSCGKNYSGYLFVLMYLAFNVFYSFGGKNIPIVDIAVLASGFLLRLLFGSAISGIEISGWLYLTVLAISFYLGLGKRRNEIKLGGETRTVLKYYTYEFLDKMMYMFMAIAIVFYSLWCVTGLTSAKVSDHVIWTVPVVMLICMRYSLIVEGESYGDPVDVILSDKIILMLVGVYAVMMLAFMYFA